MKLASLCLALVVILAAAGCSDPLPTGTTRSIGKPTATSSQPSTAISSTTGSATGGKIGGLETGGTPTMMTHPLTDFENCIQCHGVMGSALHLVDETIHACEQCHNADPEPQWFEHGNSMAAELLPRVNESCPICHKPPA